MTRKILISGADWQVVRPIAEKLAGDNEVWVLGCFCLPGVEKALQARGLHTFRWNPESAGLNGLPDDFTHVVVSAVKPCGRSPDNSGAPEVSVTGIERLFDHARNVQAFLHISSSAIYAHQAIDHLHTEDDPVDGLPNLPMTWDASERALRALVSTCGIPTVIARLSPAYGPHGHGGLPILLYRQLLERKTIAIPNRGETFASFIHTDDLARQAPLLLDKATVPSLLVNWGGDAAVSIQDAITYIAVLTGLEVRFAHADVAPETCAFDPSLRRSLVGDCEIDWREGFRRTLEHHFPGSVRTAAFA